MKWSHGRAGRACGDCDPRALSAVAPLVIAPHGEIAGSASALLGVFQFGVGALAGALVGMFDDGTALTMAVGLACCAVVGWVVLRTMAR